MSHLLFGIILYSGTSKFLQTIFSYFNKVSRQQIQQKYVNLWDFCMNFQSRLKVSNIICD